MPRRGEPLEVDISRGGKPTKHTHLPLVAVQSHMEVQPRNLPSPPEGEGCNQGFCDSSDAGEGLRRVRGAKESLARKRANPSPDPCIWKSSRCRPSPSRGEGRFAGCSNIVLRSLVPYAIPLAQRGRGQGEGALRLITRSERWRMN